jgi:hypothetical protein
LSFHQFTEIKIINQKFLRQADGDIYVRFYPPNRFEGTFMELIYRTLEPQPRDVLLSSKSKEEQKEQRQKTYHS